MTSFRADPLLGIARGVLVFIKGVLLVAGAGVVVALPTIFIMRGKLLVEVAKDQPALANMSFIWALCGLLAVVLLLLGAMWFFVQKLKQIIDTVATGDPFIPENAERLKAMAWTAIALQVIAIPLAVLGALIADKAGEHVHAHADISLNGIGLALVLFILARVFRTGAAMREELEGTV